MAVLKQPTGCIYTSIEEGKQFNDGPYQSHETAEVFKIFGKGEHKGKLIINM
jgi:hypothetical protein